MVTMPDQGGRTGACMRFHPGGYTALVSDGTAILLAHDAAHPIVCDLWTLISGKASLEELLHHLTGALGAGTSDFAISQVQDSVARVVGRGALSISSGTRVVSGMSDGPSSAQSVDISEGLMMGLTSGSEKEAVFHVCRGVVPAAWLVLDHSCPHGMSAAAPGRLGSGIALNHRDDGGRTLTETERIEGGAEGSEPKLDLAADVTAGLGQAVGGPPILRARQCPDGHLNPPHSHQCRACRQTITADAIIQAPRPALGALTLPDGRRFVVDRNLIIGRAPVGQARSRQVPELVTIPGADVSRSHVEIRLEEWSVLVIDLGSANGTSVTLPDRPPMRLRAKEPMLIVPGSRIILAEQVCLRFEAT